LKAFVLMLLILAACTQNTNPTETKVLTGTQGIKMEIMDQGIPESVFEEEQMDLIMRFTNMGAHPVTASDSILKVTLDQGYLEFDGGSSIMTDSVEVKGQEQFNRVNDFIIKQFPFSSLTLDQQSRTHDSLILATLCYNYMTTVYANVCIDTDIYNSRPLEKACTARTVSLSGGQGAPVAVTKIEPRMQGNQDSVRPQFVITIQNQDEGSVIDNINTICSSSAASRTGYNTLEIADIRFSDYTISDFECIPHTEDGRYIAKLEGEEDEVVCTLREGRMARNTETYQTPLYIELRYGYTVSKSTQVNIRKLTT